MMAINQFAETWDKVAKAIGSSSRTDIKRRVCLGFDTLDYSATSMVMQGVDVKNMPLLVEEVVETEDLPSRDDIKRLLSGVKSLSKLKKEELVLRLAPLLGTMFAPLKEVFAAQLKNYKKSVLYDVA